MNSRWLILSVAFMFLWIGGDPVAAQDLGPDAKKAAMDTNQFGLDLYGRLMGQEKGNVFFSPYSIETALAMTYAGARGQTAQQMAQTLHFDLPADKLHGAFADLIQTLNKSGGVGDQRAFDLTVANALWAQRGLAIDGKFLDITKKQYGANLEQLDFAGGPLALVQAGRTINDWVAKQTNDKIKDLIGSGSGALDASTRSILTNAIYFKSAWMTPFKKTATKEEPFLPVAPLEHKATVSMMHQTHSFSYMENDDLQAVGLPYQQNALSMVVLLPRKTDGLPSLEKSLTEKVIADWIGAMASRPVELSLPKFTFACRFQLSKTLEAMGMVDAFSDKADFSGISTAEGLQLNQVIHQAFVAVDEEGTEAAAATAVTFSATAMPRPVQPVVFRTDHPFLFLIRDNASGAILFFGRVEHP